MLSLRLIHRGILLVLAVTMAGCNLLPHNLQPHRLYRWNRHPAPSNDPYFSVPTEVPPELDLREEETENGNAV